jgi:hypothetical protein
MQGELLLENCVLHRLHIGTLERNLVRHDYDTCQRLYFQSQFSRTDTFKKF